MDAALRSDFLSDVGSGSPSLVFPPIQGVCEFDFERNNASKYQLKALIQLEAAAYRSINRAGSTSAPAAANTLDPAPASAPVTARDRPASGAATGATPSTLPPRALSASAAGAGARRSSLAARPTGSAAKVRPSVATAEVKASRYAANEDTEEEEEEDDDDDEDEEGLPAPGSTALGLGLGLGSGAASGAASAASGRLWSGSRGGSSGNASSSARGTGSATGSGGRSASSSGSGGGGTAQAVRTGGPFHAAPATAGPMLPVSAAAAPVARRGLSAQTYLKKERAPEAQDRPKRLLSAYPLGQSAAAANAKRAAAVYSGSSAAAAAAPPAKGVDAASKAWLSAAAEASSSGNIGPAANTHLRDGSLASERAMNTLKNSPTRAKMQARAGTAAAAPQPRTAVRRMSDPAVRALTAGQATERARLLVNNLRVGRGGGVAPSKLLLKPALAGKR